MGDQYPRKINLGSGFDYRKGYLNVDVNDEYGPDLLIDLEETPWDLPSDYFEVVLCQDVFEHIDPRRRPAFLEEVHRIIRPDGRFVLSLPVPEVGGGWNVTHYAVPSWRWVYNTKRGARWDVVDLRSRPVWFGRFMPDAVRRAVTRVGIRCISGTTVVLTPNDKS